MKCIFHSLPNWNSLVVSAHYMSPVFSGHPWYVQLRAAQDPSLHSMWPLAWRGAPVPGPAWGDRHEWSELWAVVVCRMRAEWDIIQTSVTRGHQWHSHKALSSSLENSAVPRVLWGWETSTITTHSPLLTTWPSCWRTKSSSPLSPMSSSTWSDCLMKVSYDHDASRLCITHLGIGMLHQSVFPDSAVTNKGVILKNYTEQQFLLSSSSVSPASSVSISSQRSGPWCGQRAEAWWWWWSCVLIAITTLFPPPSQADATLCYKEGVYLCSVFRIISQSGNNGNNNTHRAGVRTLRVIMLPGTLRRGSDEMGSVIPGPGMAVTYLTSSSRPEVPGIYTWASGMLRDSRYHARESLINVLIYCQLLCVVWGYDLWCQFLICPLSGCWGPWHRMLLTSPRPPEETSAETGSGSGASDIHRPQLMSVQSVHVTISTRILCMRCGDHCQWVPGQNIT